MSRVIHMELKFDKRKNLKERLEFIHYYAEWVKKMLKQGMEQAAS